MSSGELIPVDDGPDFILVTGRNKKKGMERPTKDGSNQKLPIDVSSETRGLAEDQSWTEIDEGTSFKDLPAVTKFAMYKALFPKKRMVVVLPEGWREHYFETLSRQFDFKIADDNLAACLYAHESAMVHEFQVFDLSKVGTHKSYYIYEFDKLHYRATLELSVFRGPDGCLHVTFNLRLSNDGFLYPPSGELQKMKSTTVEHHNSARWYLLHRDELSKLPRVVELAKNVLGTSETPKCSLFYNEAIQRMDLKFKFEDKGVCIQFEPGYPETYFDEDLWY